MNVVSCFIENSSRRSKCAERARRIVVFRVFIALILANDTLAQVFLSKNCPEIDAKCF